MKRLIFVPLLFCIFAAAAQQLRPIAHTNDPHVLTERNKQISSYFRPPTGTAPVFPSSIPDSIKRGALWVKQTTGHSDSLQMYDGYTATWVTVGKTNTYTASHGIVKSSSDFRIGGSAVNSPIGVRLSNNGSTNTGTFTLKDDYNGSNPGYQSLGLNGSSIGISSVDTITSPFTASSGAYVQASHSHAYLYALKWTSSSTGVTSGVDINTYGSGAYDASAKASFGIYANGALATQTQGIFSKDYAGGNTSSPTYNVGITVKDDPNSIGLLYNNKLYDGRNYDAWVPSWYRVKSRIDSAITASGTSLSANPSGLLTFTANNGSNTTFLRSDGRHAIDSTVVRSVSNSYSLAAMQTKLNNYVLYTDTAGAYANLVHKNGSETIAGNKVFSGTTTFGAVNMNANIVPTTTNSFNLGDATHYIGHAYINDAHLTTVSVTNFNLSSSAVFTQASSGGGKITFQTNSFASDYNWNWPTTGGADSTFLTSAGGGGSGAAMRWTAIKNYGFSRPTALSPAPGANDGSIATARYVDSSFNATATYFTGLAGSGTSGDPYHPYFVSLTTTGTSGPATLSGGVLNIPQYSGGSSYTFTNGVVNSSGTVSIDHTYSNTFTAYQSITDATTGTSFHGDGLVLQNVGTASSGVPSNYSNVLRLTAPEWNTTTSTVNYSHFAIQNVTIGGAYPYSTLTFYNNTSTSSTPGTYTRIAGLDRYGIFDAAALRGNPVTYANRPTNSNGTLVTFTDATSTTPGSVVAGSGTHSVLAWGSGSNWYVVVGI